MFRHLPLTLLAWLLLTVSSALAQLEPSVRVELPTSDRSEDTFDVLPLGERGVLVTVRHDDIYSSRSNRVSFLKYDDNLKLIWHSGYKIESYFEPVLTHLSSHYFYWLLREPSTEHFAVLRINLEDGHAEIFKGNLLTQLEIQQFKVLDNMAYIGGNYRNRPMVLSFSFFDNSAKVLPGLYVNHIQLNNIEVDEERRLVHVMTDATHKRNCEFTVQTYSYEGKLLRTVNMDGMKHSLITGKILPINDDESLLVGNYSVDCTPYSQGLYVAHIRNGEVVTDETKYIDFSQLKNFFNYLKPKRQEKMLARIDRRQGQGKNVKFRYRILVHDLVPTENGLMLIAEVYYPQYKGSGSASAVSYANRLRSFDRHQEGFRYTHAFLCGFDKSGKLLWDNCLAIQDVISHELHPMVQVSRQGDMTVLAYPQEGEINAGVIEGDKILQERQNFSMKKLSENEKVVYSEQDQLEAWFGQYFLAYGFQKISHDKRIGPPREVFYINKLTYSTKDLGKSADAPDAESATQKTSGSGR
ncbi:hypothetical protein [Tellurirhabdus bombi]|uniref:hypothetical protein n=1 Tax=Tellurirhabdus bombi TaxID=2907205 RepID=UPI001F3DCC76|nr:hypothetical protein [Tellurirhabdus bombi]